MKPVPQHHASQSIACGEYLVIRRFGRHVQGHFNKLAWIRRLLMESPREDVEWVMWIDMDTVTARHYVIACALGHETPMLA